jgi:hypothetical protein
LLTGSGRRGIATRSALRCDVTVSNSTFGLGDIGHAVRSNRSDRIRCNRQCHFDADCNNLRAASDFTSRGLSFSSRGLISTPNSADPPAAEEDPSGTTIRDCSPPQLLIAELFGWHPRHRWCGVVWCYVSRAGGARTREHRSHRSPLTAPKSARVPCRVQVPPWCSLLL